MEKFYGNYIGLVVNNQDPEVRGRVQIYVPGITNTLYDKWNNDDTDKIIGIDIGSTFTLNEEILRRLRNVLPWAEKATPLIGPGTSMYHQEGHGAESRPLRPIVNNNNKSPVSDSFDSDTPKRDSLPIDNYPTNKLTNRMYDFLLALKSKYPYAIVSSTKRKWDPAVGKARGSDGKIVEGSSESSRHNVGDAIDISINNLKPAQQKELIAFAKERGCDEAEVHGNPLHLHFAFDNADNDIAEKEAISPESPPTAAKEESATEENGPTVVTSIPYEPNVVTTQKKITIPEGTPTDYPDIPSASMVGEVPSGSRGTTKILSKVWLFFYGGDIQKPIFFAYSLPPNETYAYNNIENPNNTQPSRGSTETVVSDSKNNKDIINGDVLPNDIPGADDALLPVDSGEPNFEMPLGVIPETTDGENPVTPGNESARVFVLEKSLPKEPPKPSASVTVQ